MLGLETILINKVLLKVSLKEDVLIFNENIFRKNFDLNREMTLKTRNRQFSTQLRHNFGK